MKLIPAIDLMNGNIVRLTRGDPTTAKVYRQFGDPVKTAKKWKREGARQLHIIDLDSTFGTGNNIPIIADIAESLKLPIQVGGGILRFDTAAKLFRKGVNQVILGALAFRNEAVIGKIQEQFGDESVIVALDNKYGEIMIGGWKNPGRLIIQHKKRFLLTKLSIEDALVKFTAIGVKRFLITSIVQDGMLSGPDLITLRGAVKFSNAKIIAAGGIGSLNDLLALKRVGVEGAVIGKALYEGRFTLKEALKTVGEN